MDPIEPVNSLAAPPHLAAKINQLVARVNYLTSQVQAMQQAADRQAGYEMEQRERGLL